MADATVFGRVSPHQKRAMVHALQSRGHTVAMTGDGVNDVLALKDADCGIAMASGSEASRAVAQLVLLDSSFAALPQVVAEGRRVINNIERVASLFLTKTVYAVLLAALVGIFVLPFPFLPRQLTLVGTVTIGVPATMLALEANAELVRDGFLSRVARFAVPAGLVAGLATFLTYVFARQNEDLALIEQRTTAVLVLTGVTILVLVRVAWPLNPLRVALVVGMVGAARPGRPACRPGGASSTSTCPRAASWPWRRWRWRRRCRSCWPAGPSPSTSAGPQRPQARRSWSFLSWKARKTSVMPRARAAAPTHTTSRAIDRPVVADGPEADQHLDDADDQGEPPQVVLVLGGERHDDVEDALEHEVPADEGGQHEERLARPHQAHEPDDDAGHTEAVGEPLPEALEHARRRRTGRGRRR